tara:strand:+ start:489 stop:887 length:399 start_codon:yes stop_codon:yes gene_type:complete
LIAYGLIKPPKSYKVEKRLLYLYQEMNHQLEKFKPEAFAIEDSFYSKNVKSAIRLGQARAALMLSAAKFDIDIYEYAPRKVKQSICGSGAATKEQVKFMVYNILQLKNGPKELDITDSMAVGLCFINNLRNL